MLTKKLFAFTFILILLVASLTGTAIVASAETVEEQIPEFGAEVEDVAVPLSLITKLELTIDGGNGQVWAIAHNKISIFASSVPVVVEIYSSDSYQESYKDMTLESREYINHLKSGQSITATASTNGQQKYWKGRMYFNIDNKGWSEEVTSTWLCDAKGYPVL